MTLLIAFLLLYMMNAGLAAYGFAVVIWILHLWLYANR